MKKQAILFSGALILILIGIALVVYFFTRKSKTEETGDLPTVKDAGIELVLNPADAADKVEEYSIFTTEYAIGDTTAKNIDIKLKWTNGPTFVSVNSLIFVHKANGNKVREDVKTTDNIDSNATNELIFKGEQLTSEDIVGDNTIDMYWNKIDDTNNKLITISFKIEQKHLDTTLNLANATPIELEVKLSSASEASGAVMATHTKYRILPFFTDFVHIRKTDANDKGFHVIKGDQKQTIDDVDTFYIVKVLGKDFISKDVSGNNILNGDTKKFVTKNDIFGDVDIMNSSAITLEPEETIPSYTTGYTYDFILNTNQNSLGIYEDNGKTIYIEYIELDGVLIKKEQITTHIIPDGGAEKMTSKTSGPASWELDKINVGDKIFSIISDKKIDKIDITYTKRKTTPGWIIKENGENKIHENRVRHSFGEQEEGFKTFTYDIKNSKSTIYDVPHQILRSGYEASEYQDEWCKEGPAVHQDVPGCGRICSNNTHAWRKDKDYGKKKSWSEYPDSVDCPSAKLDEVWQKKPGTNSRYLRTGEYSGCLMM